MAGARSRTNSTTSSFETEDSYLFALSTAVTTSTASASLRIYEELRHDIDRIYSTILERDTAEYLGRVDSLISALSSSGLNQIGLPGLGLKLDRVLTGMLEHAVELDGKKYFIAAILSCESRVQDQGMKGKDEDVLRRLKAVAETWLYHFLFIFKAGPRNYGLQPYDTAVGVGEMEGLESKKTSQSFRDDLLRRDGYQCMVTGWLDWDNRHGREGVSGGVEVARVLRRVVTTFREATAASHSGAVTFDMIRHFTGLPPSILDHLEDYADHASNALTLELQAHRTWDDYGFCLQPTNIKHQYRIHYFSDAARDRTEAFRCGARVAPDELVRFMDRSEEFQYTKRRKLDDKGIPSASATGRGFNSESSSNHELPNPAFIALHAAIAGLLNMSGAGKFFDELLSKFSKDVERPPPVRCWDDLEEKVKIWQLREMLREVLPRKSGSNCLSRCGTSDGE